MLCDPSDICRAMVALKNVKILGYGRSGPVGELVIELDISTVRCPDCGFRAYVKERPWVSYVDLPVYGTPMRLLWRKHRMECTNDTCGVKSWTIEDHRIAAKRCLLTTRCAKWATQQVGIGRTVADVARELRCDWEVVNNAVVYYGEALLEADRKRLRTTTAIGLDETLFNRLGKYRTKSWCTSVVDVVNHQLIDILPSRNYVDVAGWVLDQPEAFRARIEYGALDMSRVYSAVYKVTLPKATQVVDPFHCLRQALNALDQVRRRVQQEQLAHRGRKDDPLYKTRKLLLMNAERLDTRMTERIDTLLSLGDPNAEVALAYRIKEALRDFYKADDPNEAETLLDLIAKRCDRKEMPKELQRLGKTLRRWFDKIVAWHQAKVSNGPTEALNNLIKRIKRIGFGFRNFRNYRVRALLYAGKPNWRTLGSIVVA